MTSKEIRIDGEGIRRCWNCGGRSFEPLDSIGSRIVHHHHHLDDQDSLKDSPTLKCDRCGAHNHTGDAKNYTGPADAKYEGEWAAESPNARKPYFEPAAPRQPTEVSPDLQIQADILNTIPPDLI
jgi:hypothetical protein